MTSRLWQRRTRSRRSVAAAGQPCPAAPFSVAQYDERPGYPGFSCVPEDYDGLEATLVPADDRNHPKHGGYSLSFVLDDIGTKIESANESRAARTARNAATAMSGSRRAARIWTRSDDSHPIEVGRSIVAGERLDSGLERGVDAHSSDSRSGSTPIRASSITHRRRNPSGDRGLGW
jgi:hypothetical protein